MQRVSVGRIVRYHEQLGAGQPITYLAAIVTAVNGETSMVNLTVFLENGHTVGKRDIPMVENGDPHGWSWPVIGK